MPTRRVLALVVALAGPSCLVAGTARAQGDADGQARAEASAHYARGVRAYDDGDFALALAEFERAQAISPSFRTLYNIGQVNQQLRRYARARAALRRYLVEGGDRVPEARRQEVDRDLAALAGKVARVRIVVEPAGADVLVDDVRVGVAPLTAPEEVDAGEHRVGARGKGRVPDTRLVTLAGGEEATVEIHLAEEEVAPRAPAPAPAPAPVAVVPEPRSSGPPLWIGWTTAGVLAAGAVVSGAFALSSASELDKLRRTPDSAASAREDVSSRARAFAITTDVLAVTALAAGGVALYFTLRAGPGAPSSNVGVGPRGVFFRGQF